MSHFGFCGLIVFFFGGFLFLLTNRWMLSVCRGLMADVGASSVIFFTQTSAYKALSLHIFPIWIESKQKSVKIFKWCHFVLHQSFTSVLFISKNVLIDLVSNDSPLLSHHWMNVIKLREAKRWNQGVLNPN